MGAYTFDSSKSYQSEISTEIIHRLERADVPDGVWEDIKFGKDGKILLTEALKKWLEKKKEETEQRLEKRDRKKYSIKCHIGKYGESKQLGLKVKISLLPTGIHNRFLKILLGEKNCVGKTIDIVNKITLNGNSYREIYITKGGKITVIY